MPLCLNFNQSPGFPVARTQGSTLEFLSLRDTLESKKDFSLATELIRTHVRWANYPEWKNNTLFLNPPLNSMTILDIKSRDEISTASHLPLISYFKQLPSRTVDDILLATTLQIVTKP